MCYVSVTVIYRRLLYNSGPNGVQHSHPIFLGMDEGRQYYGVYIETDGAPIEIGTMPG